MTSMALKPSDRASKVKTDFSIRGMFTNKTAMRFSTTISWKTTPSTTSVTKMAQRLKVHFLGRLSVVLTSPNCPQWPQFKLLCQLPSRSFTMAALRLSVTKNRQSLLMARHTHRPCATNKLRSSQAWIPIPLLPILERDISSRGPSPATFLWHFNKCLQIGRVQIFQSLQGTNASKTTWFTDTKSVYKTQ